MAQFRKITAMLVVLALLGGTAPAWGQRPRSRIIEGWVTGDSLLAALPSWERVYRTFQPDSLSVQVLKHWNLDQEVLVFFGSWCGDSRREVPRFLRAAEEADNPHLRIRFYGLDRSKRDEAGLAERHRISRVPTFVILEDGKELGRIVERSRHGVERDWVGILLDDPDWWVRIEQQALAFKAILPSFFVWFYLCR